MTFDTCPSDRPTGRLHRQRVERLLADRASTHLCTREALRTKRIEAKIPQRVGPDERRHAKGSAGCRPPADDPGRYQLRKVMEGCFDRLKQFRGLAPDTPNA